MDASFLRISPITSFSVFIYLGIVFLFYFLLFLDSFFFLFYVLCEQYFDYGIMYCWADCFDLQSLEKNILLISVQFLSFLLFLAFLFMFDDYSFSFYLFLFFILFSLYFILFNLSFYPPKCLSLSFSSLSN